MLVVKSRLRAWCRSVMVVVLTALEVQVYLSSCRSLWRRRPWVTAAVFSNARCCWSGPLSSYPQDDSLARRRCSVGRRRWRKLGNRLLPGGCKQRHDLTPVRGWWKVRWEVRSRRSTMDFSRDVRIGDRAGCGRLSPVKPLANPCYHVVTGGARESEQPNPMTTLSGYTLGGPQPRGKEYIQGIAAA